MHVSIMLNWGAAGNVIAYNYSDGNYDDSATNALLGDISVHGAHPQFNLWEGNSAIGLYPDSVWGSSSHNTAYRNWWRGTTQICPPYSSRGAQQSCHWGVQAVRAVQIAFTVSSFNTLGNVVGSADMAALTHYNDGVNLLPQVASIVNPTSRSYDSAAYGYTWGYANLSDGGGGEGPGNSYSTRFLHGDYNNASATTTWDSSTPNHALPASLYLTAKPAWWGSKTAWPAIGPDVLGGTGPNGHAYTIPSQTCYAGIASGATFNADTCYPSVAGTTPIAPTNLTVIVK